MLTYDIKDFNLKINQSLIINTISGSAKIGWDDLLNRIKGQILYALDLNYHLKVTEFLNWFNPDVNIKNGLDMLIYQGLMSVDIWYEKDISTLIDINILKNKLTEKYYNE